MLALSFLSCLCGSEQAGAHIAQRAHGVVDGPCLGLGENEGHVVLLCVVENLSVRWCRRWGLPPVSRGLQAYPGKPVPASRWPLCARSISRAVVSCCRPRFLQTGLEPLFFRRVTAGAGRFRGAAVSGGLLKGCRQPLDGLSPVAALFAAMGEL